MFFLIRIAPSTLKSTSLGCDQSELVVSRTKMPVTRSSSSTSCPRSTDRNSQVPYCCTRVSVYQVLVERWLGIGPAAPLQTRQCERGSTNLPACRDLSHSAFSSLVVHSAGLELVVLLVLFVYTYNSLFLLGGSALRCVMVRCITVRPAPPAPRRFRSWCPVLPASVEFVFDRPRRHYLSGEHSRVVRSRRAAF